MKPMSYLPFGAAAIIAVLATLHLIYTLRDMFSRPRYFVPRDPALLQAMQGARLALAPNGRDFWSAMLGFHLTHSIGLLLYALLIVLTVTTPLPALQPLMIGLGLVLVLIAWRCWFHIPLIGCVAATALMIAGWAL
jgi:hypothetical protein